MPTIEERVAFIEGQMSEQSHALIELRDAIRSLGQEMRDALRHLDQKMDTRFDLVDRRLAGMDERLEAVDRRFESQDRRFESFDRRFESVDRRFESLDDKISRQFVWVVGVQVTTLVAVVGALLARG